MPITLSVVEAADFPQVVDEVCSAEESEPALRGTPARFPTAQSEPLRKRRMGNWSEIVAGLRAARKRAVMGGTITIEEIIEARNEGRK